MNFCQLKTICDDFSAKQKPIIAKGKPKIVWLNFINDKYLFIVENKIKN